MSDVSWSVEAEIRVPGIAIQVVNYDWAKPVETTQCIPEHALVLLLPPRHTYSQGHYVTGEASEPFLDIGELMLAPANVPLHARASGGPVRAIRCCFGAERFEALTGLGNDWDSARLRACLNIDDGWLRKTLMRLAEEAVAPGFGSDVLAEALGISTAVEVARYLRNFSDRIEADGPGLTPWQLRRITDYLDVAGTPLPNASELAALCGISTRHLRRLFKQSTKQTLHEYTREIWVSKAKALLCETSLPLKVISSQLGFADPGNFSIAFRRVAGQPPRAFRQQFAIRRKTSGNAR